jgi:hypothetical protein
VYRRRGYQYGVIRLVEEHAVLPPGGDPSMNGQVVRRGRETANGASPPADRSAPPLNRGTQPPGEATPRPSQAARRRVRPGTRVAHG